MREAVFVALVATGFGLVVVHWILWLVVRQRARRAAAPGEEVTLPDTVPEGFPLERAGWPLAVGLATFVVGLVLEQNLSLQGFGDWVGSVMVFFWMALGFAAAHAWLEPRLPAWSRTGVVLLMGVAGQVAAGVPEFLVTSGP